MNKSMIIGRLGADPETRQTNGGKSVCSFQVATDDSYTDRDGKKVSQTDWHRVICFDRLADNCAQFLKKGHLVHIEGKLKTRQWQDQQGQTRYVTEIQAQRAEFLERRNEQQSNQQSYQPQQRSQQQQGNYDLGPSFPSESSGMDDIPF